MRAETIQAQESVLRSLTCALSERCGMLRASEHGGKGK